MEKLAIQVTCVAALGAGYFLLWPLVRAADGSGPMTFLVSSGLGRLGIFAIGFWLIAAACGVLTSGCRVSGAMAAALAGAVGLCLRSGQMRDLLWVHGESVGGLYITLIAELLILAVIAFVGWLIINFVRGLIRSGPTSLATLLLPPSPDEPSTSAASGKTAGQALISCIAVVVGVSIAMLISLMRSADRGQIIFAMVASFFLAFLLAGQLFPSRYAVLGWLLPLAAGVASYAIAAISALPEGPQSWVSTSMYARALPIDWIAAGGAGAALGEWISRRVHRARILEQQRLAALSLDGA